MHDDDHKKLARDEVQRRVREGIKAVLQELMEEEMVVHIQARHRERTERRRGERNGHYRRSLTTEVVHIEQLRVPRAREGAFLLFEARKTPLNRCFGRFRGVLFYAFPSLSSCRIMHENAPE